MSSQLLSMPRHEHRRLPVWRQKLPMQSSRVSDDQYLWGYRTGVSGTKGISAIAERKGPSSSTHSRSSRKSVAYGHFGRDDIDFSWERVDGIDARAKAAGRQAYRGCRSYFA
jgi:hypothetical protein